MPSPCRVPQQPDGQDEPKRKWRDVSELWQIGHPAQGIEPFEPQVGRNGERDSCDQQRRTERDAEAAPLSTEGEPQDTDARRDLGEEQEAPSAGPSKPGHDRRSHQDVHVA
jgi:hypothetical protein